MKSRFASHAIIGVLWTTNVCFAFVPTPMVQNANINPMGRFQVNTFTDVTGVAIANRYQSRQRTMAIHTRLMGIFGLGAGEIAIILVAILLLLGPQKIAELGRDAGKLTGELKEVPKEFQKGLAEGEIDARAKKAKPMDTSEE